MISDVTSSILPGFSMSKNVVIDGSKVSVSWYIDLLNTPKESVSGQIKISLLSILLPVETPLPVVYLV
jgi:hypothetical protein